MDLKVVPSQELSTRQLHDLLRLRVDVFVVEQECVYPELDGRDLEEGTTHLWLAVEGRIAAAMRLLSDPGVHKIGRVVTDPEFRGTGHAARLMAVAIEHVGSPIELEAQSHLHDWYQRFGFERTGPEYVEDGIPHIPMRRDG